MKNSSKEIRVLFISHSSGMVGAEKSLLSIIKNINKKCFTPIVILPPSGLLNKDLCNLNIKTYNISCPWWVTGNKNILWKTLKILYCTIQEIVVLSRIYNIVKKERINVIYTNTVVNYSGAIISKILKIPHIWHVREVIINNPDLHFILPAKVAYNLILKSSNTVVVNSNATATQFRTQNPTEKIKLIYNALNFSDFQNTNSLLNIEGVKETDWVVGVIGTLQRRKGQDDALRAINIVKKKIPNIKLLLIGEGDEEYKKYLKELILKLDLSENVILMGYREDVPQILPNLKVVLVPSWNEPFGRVVIEAMAAGVPVIGSNSGGIKEIIDNNINGYLVPPKNPLRISEQIIYLNEHPEIAKKLGTSGKEKVKQKYNIENYIRNVETVIRVNGLKK